MRFTKSITIITTFLTILFAQTANLSLTNYDADTGSVDVYMVNDVPVGGFQFEISGVSGISTSGGTAAASGFTISTGGNTVLGFSFSGATIPVGEGVLTTISGVFDGSDVCLSLGTGAISDSAGQALDVEFGDCVGGAPDYTVNSGSYYYTPAELSVEIGETVEWVNDGGFHDVVVTSGPVLFSLPACSGPCTIGSYTFEEPGTYDYICSIGSHEAFGMVGTITVNGPSVPGCTDSLACNYNESATEDDGTCTFAQENFDCDGNCLVDTDCNGDCGGDAIVDECGECGGDGSTCATTIVEIGYESYAPIGGFQFNVESGTLVSASGGDAAANGFTVSTGGNLVIGFSLTGSTIPAGAGVLLELEIEGADETCISDLVISDSSGTAVDYELNCTDFVTLQVLEGCTDASACNYDENANVDDGSCSFAEENFDCDGNCLVDTDCNGDCGGDAVVDECGICGGSGYFICWDGSEVCDDATCPDQPSTIVDILYDVDTPIGGFQFNVESGTLVSATGGDAAANGFTVSTGGNLVIGFSLTGSTIPAGSGTLVSLEIEGADTTCISDLVLSDPAGTGLDYTLDCNSIVVSAPVLGCTDASACNYEADATEDDGTCTYAEENFDCDGNCLVDTDCNGDCGGDAIEDCAGVCNGSSVEITFCEDTDGDGLGNPGTETVQCIDQGRDITDGCELPENNLYLTENGSVFYSTNQPIGGFQFTVDGATASGASGGDSGDAGFTVSTGGSTVLGFSFTGATIPAGCGTLLDLELSGSASSLSNIVVSDSVGGAIPFSYYYGEDQVDLVADCTDSYPDCSSNIVDCAGDCDGDAVEDCAGLCNGDSLLDECGVCDGDNSTCLDSCGIPNGDDSTCSVSISFGNVNENLMEILVVTGNTEMGGFQFNITGVNLETAGGGLAADNGFTVSTGLTTVIGFSLTGSTIPANSSGILTELVYTATSNEACLELGGGAISDPLGNALPVSFGGCIEIEYVVSGCTDENACNYNSDATEDDGSCTYADENFDCEGNCLVFDECGECGGDGSACTVYLSFGDISSDNMEILYNSPSEIGGFQFNVSGLAEVTGASGGSAESEGFTVSTGNNIIIGFSLTGSTIPSGSGSLTNLAYVCDYVGLEEACLADIVISDPSGTALISQFTGDCALVGDDAVNGCTDIDACNYNENANSDDGSCEYPEQNFDCNGDCLVDIDCNDVCGGSAVEDCAGECGGSAETDECGVCQGDNSSCSGCTDESANNYDSDAIIDDNSCNFDHFYTAISGTGVSQSVIFSETISLLEDGDEIGIFDQNGLLSNGDCSSEYGNLLVGNGVWSGEQLNLTAISSIDFCNFPDGYQLPGFVENNPIIIKIYDTSEGVEYDVNLTITAGSENFEETSFVVISELEIVELGCTDSSACNYDSNANTDDGSCDYPEENFDCNGDCLVDVDCNGECGGDAIVDECGECGGDGSSCTSEATNTINLASNWNWISFNVYQDDMSLANIFSSVAVANDGIDNVNFIKSQLDGTSTWYETFGWFGALETLDNRQMYQVLMNDSATLTFTGTPVDPSQTPIDLASNWNWIGFLPQSPTPIATAFGSIAIANDGVDNVNFIKSQLDGTSTWYETFGWFGALEVLQPTKGYQLLMNNPATLFYPNELVAISDDSNLSDDITMSRQNDFDVIKGDFNPREFEYNGTITLSVDNINDSTGDILAAYVNGELRGITECVYFPYGDKNIYIIQVYSNQLSGEEITFELHDSLTGNIHMYNETVIFENDMVIGDGFATLSLNDNYTDGVIPSESSLGKAYPNPFNPTTNFEYNISSDMNVSIAVYDISGQVVEMLVNDFISAGTYNISWNAGQLSSGIYFIGMNAGDASYVQKVMLVK